MTLIEIDSRTSDGIGFSCKIWLPGLYPMKYIETAGIIMDDKKDSKHSKKLLAVPRSDDSTTKNEHRRTKMPC